MVSLLRVNQGFTSGYKRFRDGRKDVEDDERPSTSTTDENVKETITNDRRNHKRRSRRLKYNLCINYNGLSPSASVPRNPDTGRRRGVFFFLFSVTASIIISPSSPTALPTYYTHTHVRLYNIVIIF